MIIQSSFWASEILIIFQCSKPLYKNVSPNVVLLLLVNTFVRHYWHQFVEVQSSMDKWHLHLAGDGSQTDSKSKEKEHPF